MVFVLAIRLPWPHAHMHTRAHTHTRARTHTHTRTHTHAHTHIHIHTHTTNWILHSYALAVVVLCPACDCIQRQAAIAHGKEDLSAARCARACVCGGGISMFCCVACALAWHLISYSAMLHCWPILACAVPWWSSALLMMSTPS